MISRSEILKQETCPLEFESNLEKLLIALNAFRSAYGKPMIVTSGYRTPEHNAEIGGAKHSAHLTCEAADFLDQDRSLTLFCITNLPLLESCGLWMESPIATPSWVHLQTRPTKNRVFHP